MPSITSRVIGVSPSSSPGRRSRPIAIRCSPFASTSTSSRVGAAWTSTVRDGSMAARANSNPADGTQLPDGERAEARRCVFAQPRQGAHGYPLDALELEDEVGIDEPGVERTDSAAFVPVSSTLSLVLDAPRSIASLVFDAPCWILPAS